MSELKPGPVENQPTISPEDLIPINVPEPEYIIRGNKVKCPWCPHKFKTRTKYISHFVRSHES